jgi:hypothetical protein
MTGEISLSSPEDASRHFITLHAGKRLRGFIRFNIGRHLKNIYFSLEKSSESIRG